MSKYAIVKNNIVENIIMVDNPDTYSVEGADLINVDNVAVSVGMVYDPESGVFSNSDAAVEKFKNDEINRAHDLALSIVHESWDDTGLMQILYWVRDPATPQGALDLINAFMTWKDAIMFEYLMNKKIAILYGLPYDMNYSFIGPTPCKFTDVFLVVKPEFQPPGWTPPDVSNYEPGTR